MVTGDTLTSVQRYTIRALGVSILAAYMFNNSYQTMTVYVALVKLVMNLL